MPPLALLQLPMAARLGALATCTLATAMYAVTCIPLFPSAAVTAAHGGQVACEEHLAAEVLDQWQQQLQQTQKASSLGKQPRPVDAAVGVVHHPVTEGDELQVPRGSRVQEEEGLAQPEGARCEAGGGLSLEGADGTMATVEGVTILLAAPGSTCTPASGTANAIRSSGSTSVVENAAGDDSGFWQLPEGSVAEGGTMVEAVAHRLGMFRCALGAPLTPECRVPDLAS